MLALRSGNDSVMPPHFHVDNDFPSRIIELILFMLSSTSSRTKKVSKGAPSGFVISLIFHAAVFFLAGLFVVFSVVNKPEPAFEPPPPVERPKMKLKKPKVKVKKSSQPKPSSRIVAKVKTRDMPEIQLPDLMGSGEGLMGGTGLGGEFMDLPEIQQLTVFGRGVTAGNDFVGTYYDFNRTRRGTFNSMDPDTYYIELLDFVTDDWDTRNFAKYYRSPDKLYATCFMIPSTPSDLGPEAFGELGAYGYCWAIHYVGQLIHNEGIKFRFWGYGDDLLIVRVDGEIVLSSGGRSSVLQRNNGWTSSSSQSDIYYLGNGRAQVGDWITLEPGVERDMEVLVGESPGGIFSAMLVVEVEGVDYELNVQGGPILPMFTTEQPSHATLDSIYEWLIEGEACLTNGPVFSDFTANRSSEPSEHEEIEETRPKTVIDENPMRTWTLASGKSISAEYVRVALDVVYLRLSDGSEVNVPIEKLSEEDRSFLELLNLPKLEIAFLHKSDHLLGFYKGTPFLNRPIPAATEHQFGARVEMERSKPYTHPLKVQYYAIGRQLQDRDKYILMEKKSAEFTPSAKNNYSLEFTGNKIRMIESTRDGLMGRAHAGYIVVVTDSRGEIIAHKESSKWLFHNFEKLQKLPLNSFFDDTCKRVYPTGATARRY